MGAEQTRASLRRFVLLFLGVLILLVVLGYSIGLRFFFTKGLEQSMSDMLELGAVNYARRYQADLETPLPTGTAVTYTRDFQQLPPAMRRTFPVEEHRGGVMMFNEDHMEGGWFGPGDFQISLMMPYRLHDGSWLYQYLILDQDSFTQASIERFDRTANLIFPIGGFFILIFLVGAFYLIARLTRPMEEMARWADSLTLETRDRSIPGFRYRELDQVAARLQQAFQRIGEVLAHEQQFLRNASHELRTPIAVIGNNAELLARILPDHPKAMPPVRRIERAAANMRQLTETLLWLAREGEQAPPLEEVDPAQMVEGLVAERRYLLEGKTVELEIQVAAGALQTARTPCRIALGNLIRNAFQYTAEGEIRIEYAAGRFTVSNADQTNSAPHADGDFGYGLGLALVEMITDRMNWTYSMEEIPGGRRVLLEPGDSRIAGDEKYSSGRKATRHPAAAVCSDFVESGKTLKTSSKDHPRWKVSSPKKISVS